MSPTSLAAHGAPTTASVPGSASAAAPCLATVAIVLAGQGSSTRTARLSTSLGLPIAALPINGERNLVECWIRRIAEAGFAGTVVIAITSESERAYFEALSAPPGMRIEVRVDSSGHRGAGGTVGDAWRELRERPAAGVDWTGGVLVIEASNPPQFDFARLFATIDRSYGAVIGAAGDASLSGISWISETALSLIPTIGYFDLKEQLVTAIVASGRSVQPCFGWAESCRIVDRESYLRAVALMHDGSSSAYGVDALIEQGAVVRGDSIVCRGAVVERGALVIDSAILPGARVCADAVVARSIVPPGSHVPCGYLVVDEIFGALGSPARSGTEGGAS